MSIDSRTNHDHGIIIEGCILSWVAGASEEGPVGPRRSELVINYHAKNCCFFFCSILILCIWKDVIVATSLHSARFVVIFDILSFESFEA